MEDVPESNQTESPVPVFPGQEEPTEPESPAPAAPSENMFDQFLDANPELKDEFKARLNKQQYQVAQKERAMQGQLDQRDTVLLQLQQQMDELRTQMTSLGPDAAETEENAVDPYAERLAAARETGDIKKELNLLREYSQRLTQQNVQQALQDGQQQMAQSMTQANDAGLEILRNTLESSGYRERLEKLTSANGHVDVNHPLMVDIRKINQQLTSGNHGRLTPNLAWQAFSAIRQRVDGFVDQQRQADQRKSAQTFMSTLGTQAQPATQPSGPFLKDPTSGKTSFAGQAVPEKNLLDALTPDQSYAVQDWWDKALGVTPE